MNNYFSEYWKTIKDLVLDLLFPRQCLGCGRENVWLCSDCFQKIKLDTQLLPHYDYLNGVWVGASFQDPLLQKIIHLYKYQYIAELASVLGRIISRPVAYETEDWLLLPVPLHKKKQLARGFNQAELLAQVVSQKKNWPVLTDVLSRRKHTRAQVSLKREQREKI